MRGRAGVARKSLLTLSLVMLCKYLDWGFMRVLPYFVKNILV